MGKQKKDIKEKKSCSKCKVNFRTTYSSWCLICIKKGQEKWELESNYDSKKQHQKNYQKNKEKHIANAIEWGKNNREKRSHSQMKYINNNVNAKLASRLRTRMYHVLKGINKSTSTLNLLGCTIAEFHHHLENQFTPEMNWENYGSYWEMDHIKPCDSFDLSNLEEQKKCFIFTNIQPLEKVANRIKSNKH